MLPLGTIGMWQTLRFAITVASRRPEKAEIGSGNVHDDDQDKQETEALMEDCVDSSEDIGLPKAKSNVKNLEESHNTSINQKFWARVHGIGPARKGVASMISHRKDEFFSALQHYWLGVRLLWLDVRISSRLLPKLSSGKKLSRRERSQLTRTTADIFRAIDGDTPSSLAPTAVSQRQLHL